MTLHNKPRGYFEKLLAIDCETTGLCFSSDSPVFNPTTGERHQTVSWGLIVADANTFKPIEKLYVEIKWNTESKRQKKIDSSFGQRAEQVHGLTYDYLEKNGVTEEEAVEKIGSLIIKHFGTNSLKCLGHNVHLFDVPFLRDLFERHEVPLVFGNRHNDSSSLGFGTVGSFNSDDLFKCFGFEERKEHNSLQDAENSLEIFRLTRLLWQSKVGLMADSN
jgi:DNA polymerase III epsilon subunit-like protein